MVFKPFGLVEGMVFKPFGLVEGMVFKPFGLAEGTVFKPFGLVYYIVIIENWPSKGGPFNGIAHKRLKSGIIEHFWSDRGSQNLQNLVE